MRITIAERLRPFSHSPGVFCVLPGTTKRLQVFPTLIRVEDLSIREIAVNLKGPVKEFTVQQDLEKGYVKVWGYFQKGYVRFRLFRGTQADEWAIQIERCPQSGVALSILDRNVHAKETIVVSGEKVKVAEVEGCIPQDTERLSLGSHRGQDWDLVMRRKDLKEIFPVWYRLGRLTSSPPITQSQGTLSLLERCQEVISQQNKLDVVPSFTHLLNAALEGILSPRLIDTEHQGFALPPLPENFEGSPLAILTHGATLIRRLFFEKNDTTLKILPLLPPEFHCGRFINLDCGSVGMLDLEWSKKTVRRMVLHAKANMPLNFSFQKGLRSYRMRKGAKDRGQRITINQEINIQSGETYFFDNFLRSTLPFRARK